MADADVPVHAMVRDMRIRFRVAAVFPVLSRQPPPLSPVLIHGSAAMRSSAPAEGYDVPAPGAVLAAAA